MDGTFLLRRKGGLGLRECDLVYFVLCILTSVPTSIVGAHFLFVACILQR